MSNYLNNMKRITLTTSLFFCLAITTILAQVVTTNIATPNSSGLSDNQVVSFDVNSDGTILNNSASDGTAQLGGTAVTANSNITADSEADLILLQVTGSTGSDLDGTIEVFGTEAGIIIANPNGIVCDGCAFTNVNRVDLVTGTYNITTGTYSISDNDVNVDGGGLLTSNVDVLNIQTNNFTTVIGVGVTGDTFNLSVAGDFSNIDTSINVNTFNLSVAGDFTSSASGINVDTFNLSLAGDFSHSNYSYITANTFNFSVAGDFDDIVEYRNDVFYTNNNGRLFVNALNLNVDGDFTFSESANNLTLRANDSLTVSGTANITAASFNNSGAIDVDNSFNATVGTFINEAGATITAIGECNIVYTTSYTDNGTITCQNVVLETMVIDIATPNSNGLSDNQVDDFDVNAYGTILNNSAGGGTAQLGGTAVTANSNITAGSEASLILFQVTGSTVSDLDGTVEVFGGEAGLIIANPNGIACGGCGFINADRVDLVTGTYNIATETYSISDNDFTVDGGGLLANTVGVLNIQTNNFSNSGTSGIGVSADTFNLSVAGDFSSGGVGIAANTFNLSVAGDFTTGSSTVIIADTFNLSLAGDFTHGRYSEIMVNTFNLSLAGDFDKIVSYGADYDTFYTNNEGRIIVNALNLNVGGDFTFSESANNFIWRANDNLTVSGNANITAASFNNSGAIDVDNIFNAMVDNFINEAGATITAIGECNIVYTTSYTDNGTITCQDAVLETMVIDIATPNSNGLSDNQVDDFDVNAYGTILNNSASDGTAQLGSTAVTANSNITAGSEASLILLQVTGSTVSDLGGTIEVFGGEAGIIIANPNGITCTGCGFINADRVDLVTGTYNIATETYGISDNDVTVDGGGLLASTVGVLNIQTNNFTNTSELGVSANTFNLSVADDFINNNYSRIIVANTFNLSVAGDFVTNSGSGIESNTFNLSLAGDFDKIVNYRADDDRFITNNDGFIKVNALNLNVGGDFTFSNSANNLTLRANDSLTVLGDANITAAEFENSGTITADTLNLSVAGDFDYRTDFLNAGTITADNLNFTARDGVFTNDTTIELAGNLGITANSFTNTGGVVSADTFALSVAGDFNYVTDFLNNGTISNDALNLTVGGNFTNDDSASNFTWDAQNSLVVSGDANITTNNYTQSGAIDVAGVLTINALTDFTYSNSNNNFIWDTNDSLIVTGNANITANNFNNSGSITVTGSGSSGSLNIATGYTAINQGSIVSGSLDVITADFFRNLTGGDISTDTLNIIAGGKVTNTANITVGILTITANNDSTRTNDTTGFYVSNRGNITATSLNIAAVDNFYNRGNITATNFNITRAKSVFFLNKEIDSFYAAGHTYDGGNISLSGDSSFRADGGSIENYGNIDLGDNILDISADSFTNHEDANVTANTVNLDVNSLIQNGTVNATVEFK